MIAARFDDLLPGTERSFRLTRPVGELAASSAADVADVFERAQAEAEAGRWVAGFVAYEAAPALDPALGVRARERDGPFANLPFAWFGLFEAREPVPPPEPRPGGEDGLTTGGAQRGAFGPAASGLAWRPSVGRDRFVEAVERIRDLIARGETYQVNHTLRMRTTFGPTVDLDRLYADLILAQRAAFGADISSGRYRVLGASPELFFWWRANRVTTRPMKGTAPRGRWPEEDAAAADRLRASAKDRAENAMIVDLLRNDLGRVAVPGTVVAGPLFDVERYETVWQMTSTVSAEVPDRTSLLDVFRALFPSGSVTGAPKVASMRAIAELEDAPRGVYTGAVGFLAPPAGDEPRAVFGVGIRTIQLDTRTGTAEFGAGAGITFASSGDAEYAEVQAKARVLFERRPAFELFETLAWEPGGRYRHLQAHLARLEGSARYFGFAFDRRAIVERLNETAADASASVRVRVTLARDGSVRIDSSPLPEPAGDAIRVAIVETPPVDPDDVWLYHKTTLRAPYERRRLLRPDVDDVVLVNTVGRVTESTIANVAIRLGGEWWTPPVADGLLPGTYRDALLREGALGERSVSLDEVRRAAEVALISSVRGWRPAAVVD